MASEQQKDPGWSKIDDAMVERMRANIGRESRYKNPWHTAVTLDNLKHFALGIGDPNPLWWRPEYASKTRYGTCIAPPTFAYSTSCGPSWYPDDPGTKGRGLPGIHGLWAGDTWEWYRPLKVGEQVVAITKLTDIKERPRSSYAERVLEEDRETRIEAGKGEVVAKYIGHYFRFERGKPKEKKKYTETEPTRYTEAQLQEVWDAYANEEVRGAQPRYWEDVKIGDAVGPMVKGPLTVTSLFAWFQGWGGHFCITDKVRWDYFNKHPKAAIKDPVSGIPDVPARVHWDPWFAREIGFGVGGYDVGGQRISWALNLVTNWMGDDGFIKWADVQVRRPNFLGDVQWFRGKVTAKHERDGEHLVDVEAAAESQRHETTTTLRCTVLLPSRGR